MNKSIEKLLLNFKEMTCTEKKLTEEETKRFCNVSYNRIYSILLERQGYDTEGLVISAALNKPKPVIKAINPLTGEVIYEGYHGQGRVSLTSLGYKPKINKRGKEFYVKRPSLFGNNSL
ncbi:hypothetical protein HYT26_04585 [Candidatus Pacearchaeota archaeon]|nr:hypothetical protein [Candidatus Pacearchaeota archaeon]